MTTARGMKFEKLQILNIFGNLIHYDQSHVL